MDEFYMKQAIEMAKLGHKMTYQNPLVGCVIVKDNNIIAKGAHLKYGSEHAERHAILACQTPENLINSTIYITLEPCHHEGKQPPCTDIIVTSGIKKVVIAQRDPNPLVSGKGIAYLKSLGIEVVEGILEKEAYEINTCYNFFYQNQRPYVVLKQAITWDGKLSQKGRRTQLSSSNLSKIVHLERDNYQAILVGANTVLTDNPKLLGQKTSLFPPLRVILDKKGGIFDRPELNIFIDNQAPVLIFSQRKVESLPHHVTVVSPCDFSIKTILDYLYQEGIQSVYVEGGSQIHEQFLATNLWEELITYISPKLLGGDALPAFYNPNRPSKLSILHDVSSQIIGEEIRLSGKREAICLQD